MKKSPQLTTAYDMFVHYNGNCMHYAIIFPPSFNQCCRLKLAKAFGWENPEDVSSWEFILPNILDREVKVHLMEHKAGAMFSPKEMFYTSQSSRTPLNEHKFGSQELREYAYENNSREQVRLVMHHLFRYATYLGGCEIESRYDSERWQKHLTKVTGD